jgi:hypothetical protein
MGVWRGGRTSLPPPHSLHFAKGDATQHLLVLRETEDKN